MPGEAQPATIAVLDEGGSADWAQLGTPARNLDVPGAVALVATAPPQAVTLCAEPRTALALLQALSAMDEHGALTLLVPAAGEHEHPHVRLMRALGEGKRAWEAAFDAIVDPLLVLDAQGRVQRANVQLARAVARPIEELPGCTHVELLGLAGDHDPIVVGLADGRARTVEARFPALAAVQQVTISPIRGSLDRLAGLVVLLKDLGALRHEQELLQQASRLADIGQLAAGVAHEINTPLASIALRAESLLRAAQDTRVQQLDSLRNFSRYLETILEETFRCKRIIGALLEFSAQRPPERRATDVNRLVERAADLVGHQMQLRRVTLALQLQEPLEAIPADAGQLRQVLLALLMNALDATPEGGHIHVRTRGAQDGVELIVEDDGAGMPPEVLDKVFTPFYTTKPLGQGTGLGLPICHGIVALHGGHIAIDSTPGSGTRVTVSLPGTPPTTPPAAEER